MVINKMKFMAKKDFENMGNSDRGNDEKENSLRATEEQNQDSLESNKKTQVKNAHASGLGSIGRNDENQNSDISDQSNINKL